MNSSSVSSSSLCSLTRPTSLSSLTHALCAPTILCSLTIHRLTFASPSATGIIVAGSCVDRARHRAARGRGWRRLAQPCELRRELQTGPIHSSTSEARAAGKRGVYTYVSQTRPRAARNERLLKQTRGARKPAPAGPAARRASLGLLRLQYAASRRVGFGFRFVAFGIRRRVSGRDNTIHLQRETPRARPRRFERPKAKYYTSRCYY